MPMYLCYSMTSCHIEKDCANFIYFRDNNNVDNIYKIFDFEKNQLLPPHYKIFFSFTIYILSVEQLPVVLDLRNLGKFK